MATIAQTAAHLDLSERRIYELQEKGVIPKAARGDIDLDASRIAYIRHVRESASGRLQEGELDPAQERARKDRALAIQTELKNDEARGGLVAIEAVGIQVAQIFTVIRALFLGLPSRVCSRFGTDRRAELNTLIHDMVCEILTELSSPEALPVVKEAGAKRARSERRINEKGDPKRTGRGDGGGGATGPSTKGRGRGSRPSATERGGREDPSSASSATRSNRPPASGGKKHR